MTAPGTQATTMTDGMGRGGAGPAGRAQTAGSGAPAASASSMARATMPAAIS